MATGDRVKIITSTQFDQLNEQINNASNGIAGRVNTLENNADISNANPYDPARAYVAGNLAIVDGRLRRANRATTGALVLADWDDPSPTATVTANRAVVSDENGKLVPSATTAAEIAQIRGGAAIQDDDIVDDSAFVHNASGTMKQTGFPALLRWILSKLNGTASSMLKDELTASTVMIVDENKKAAASGVTPTELSVIDGDTAATSVTLEDADRVVVNDDGTMLQAAMSSVLTYISTKLGLSNASSVITASNAIVPATDELEFGSSATSGNRWKVFATAVSSEDGYSVPGSNIVFSNTNGAAAYFSGGGSLRRGSSTSTPDIGESNSRYRNIYLSNNPNVSSDEDLKEEIKEIPEALLEVWFEHVQPVQYLMKDRNKSHEANQINVGYIAQDVIAAFDAAGIDWHLWDVVSENTDFEEEDGEPLFDEEGNVIEKPDYDYYSVNYAAAQLIEQAAIRHKLGIGKSKRFN
ncbi:TPA: tail fiber domain-containing protein [Vibrio cholerae]|uniref:tail fiber domain-containing protein n=1 Tax=Vibrio cholerae TaxID=666 RepID=UPI00005F460F|nr:tail fiber domain-containing protein [Vibrio cholerae]EGR0073214.1 tail fiber domain-containing protein [Vibrio cholerae]EJL6764624.1 tail fiber domain-containing protein [Vibrio cholerae]EJL6959353.1 tail fiber domain-containing protein [Vibrio cholerae]EKF9465851.1 tail fiber domain-containing protein [Vibrio cholerae]EMC8696611.1 tail fiber domain-containing protein [Vibrio cholerae]